uniref:Uncharacterized protein n=1 Tax=Babesia bovis TaxID=5865 RepID=S6BL58_BABBO|nr:hypothetical protein [Babesia bovis]
MYLMLGALSTTMHRPIFPHLPTRPESNEIPYCTQTSYMHVLVHVSRYAYHVYRIKLQVSETEYISLQLRSGGHGLNP